MWFKLRVGTDDKEIQCIAAGVSWFCHKLYKTERFQDRKELTDLVVMWVVDWDVEIPCNHYFV